MLNRKWLLFVELEANSQVGDNPDPGSCLSSLPYLVVEVTSHPEVVQHLFRLPMEETDSGKFSLLEFLPVRISCHQLLQGRYFVLTTKYMDANVVDLLQSQLCYIDFRILS